MGGERVAHAQGGTISGVVLDRNQGPLEGAQVTVRGTRLGSQTDANGRFRIAGVEGTAATLEVRRLGYRMTTVAASVGAETSVSMEPASVNLDAVVVTGQPGSTNKRTLGVVAVGHQWKRPWERRLVQSQKPWPS